jgi:ectoine hydroxylase-related dioxygenase (phytanoyl-CoA dioxygenase family)
VATVVSAAGSGSAATWGEQGYVVIRRVDVGSRRVAADIVAELAGPGAHVVASRVDVAPPGRTGGPWGRAGASAPDGDGAAGAPAVVVWHALTEATLENGCPWVVPGSHLGPVGDFDRDGAVPVLLVPGDVLVLDARLRCRSSDNHSTLTRVSVVVDYAGNSPDHSSS